MDRSQIWYGVEVAAEWAERAAYVVASKVVDVGLRQHGVVWSGGSVYDMAFFEWGTRHTFELRLAERGGVAGDDDELGLARTEGL